VTSVSGDQPRDQSGLGRGLRMDIIAEGIRNPGADGFLHAEGSSSCQVTGFGRRSPPTYQPLLDACGTPDFKRSKRGGRPVAISARACNDCDASARNLRPARSLLYSLRVNRDFDALCLAVGASCFEVGIVPDQ